MKLQLTIDSHHTNIPLSDDHRTKNSSGQRTVNLLEARNSGERTRLACWFRRCAETDFSSVRIAGAALAQRKVRDRGTRSPARETRALPRC